MTGFTMEVWELRGAYGREVTFEDWIEGKDFRIHHGPYCSIRDVEHMRQQGVCALQFHSWKTGYPLFCVSLDNPTLKL